MELSRQGGGIGSVGIGETNSERMKRHLKEKERKIKDKLSSYQKGRDLARSGRARKGLKTVSIVGYTNAGKTTLLNALTGRKEYAANELFATLDTRVGELFLPGRRSTALISDTIGFIKDLPPELLNAFSSTLSEAMDADLLVHVVDGSDQNWERNIQVVDEILKRLGGGETPRILVFNKEDKTSDSLKKMITKIYENDPVLWISAVEKEGLKELVEKIENSL